MGNPSNIFDLPLSTEDEIKEWCTWVEDLKQQRAVEFADFYIAQEADLLFLLYRPSGRYMLVSKFKLATHWKPFGEELVRRVEGE